MVAPQYSYLVISLVQLSDFMQRLACNYKALGTSTPYPATGTLMYGRLKREQGKCWISEVTGRRLRLRHTDLFGQLTLGNVFDGRCHANAGPADFSYRHVILCALT